MPSPISPAQADRLIAATRSRIGERPPRIQVTGSPFASASRARQAPARPPALPTQSRLAGPAPAASITTMVPYRASNTELRSRRYNLSATRMRNINMRIGSLNEIILEVYGLSVDLPMILKGNRYEEPGDPPSLRRIPNSQTGFEQAYNRMMRDAKKNEHTPSPRNNKYTTLYSHADFSGRGINMKHPGALRYVVQDAIKNKKWQVNYRQESQTPSITRGITYDVSIASVLVNDFGQAGNGFGFSRQARVKINRPKDIEGIMDLRYTEEDEKRDEEKLEQIYGEADRINKKEENRSRSDRTLFYRDCLITFREVTTVTTTGGASGSNLNIADAPTINCLIAGFYHRFTTKMDEIDDDLKLLPLQRKGRPRTGEIRDAKSTEERKRLNREHKNITKRAGDLLALNERVQILGGINHTDLHLMKELIQLSGANSLTIISPLYPKFGSYLHVNNPNPITGKVHGVIKTPVKMLLTTPTHVESFTASTFGFVTTDTEIVKLNVAEMIAKHAELIKSDGTLITYPSNNQSCPQRILRSDGTVYALQTPYNFWANEKWKPQIKRATMNSADIAPEVFWACIHSVLLTGRCRFELYDTFPRGEPEDREIELDGDDEELRQMKPRITDENIINIDQSKAYTRAFDPCMSPFLATPGCCIGKISEVFSLSSREEMKDMLSQKIEGLLAINTSTVDFSTVCSEKIIEYLRIDTPDLNTDYITAAKIHETLTNVYTTKIARSYKVDDRGFEKLQAPTVPKILTFPEARFWLMCGLTFEAHIAMISYDSVPISWDDTSHTKEGGIRHYAKAVGVGMSTSLNSRFHMSGTEVQAQQYYALALEDPNLDETRVRIRTVGENTIEIEHPLAGVNTTAHHSYFLDVSSLERTASTA
ncbi:hypothetical protein T492DRAFT_850314 [Pavlovales sp. CCMP2436]|nr:hypothetical protein T492DRAFT_850314 [Pavlovales sp. CCMP2436]